MSIEAHPAPRSVIAWAAARVVPWALAATPLLSLAQDAQWESCLSETQVEARVARYKASVEQYRDQVQSLESQLRDARRAPQPASAEPAASPCELQQTVLDELSDTRSTLAVREGEVERLSDQLDKAAAETARARERIAQLQKQLGEAPSASSATSPAPSPADPRLERALSELQSARDERRALATQLQAAQTRIAQLEAGPGGREEAPAAGTAIPVHVTERLDQQARTIAELREALAAAELGGTQAHAHLALQEALSQTRHELAESEARVARLREELRRRELGLAPESAIAPRLPTTTSEANQFLKSLPETEWISTRKARVSGRAEVFEAPTRQSAQVGFLDEGRVVELIGRSLGVEPQWYRLRTPQGASGWVVAAQLDLGTAP